MVWIYFGLDQTFLEMSQKANFSTYLKSVLILAQNCFQLWTYRRTIEASWLFCRFFFVDLVRLVALLQHADFLYQRIATKKHPYLNSNEAKNTGCCWRICTLIWSKTWISIYLFSISYYDIEWTGSKFPTCHFKFSETVNIKKSNYNKLSEVVSLSPFSTDAVSSLRFNYI